MENQPPFQEALAYLSGSGGSRKSLDSVLCYAKSSRLTIEYVCRLAEAIARSGHASPVPRGDRPITSIHSTGGPGSLTTLLSPVLVAATGVDIPLVSVQGSIAGAIDSLAVIPGYRVNLSPSEFVDSLRCSGLVHVGHDGSLFAPADQTLWQARGDTSTKEIPGLIAASLLGKKLALGVQNGAIDVRVGRAGNAGKDFNTAFECAHELVTCAQAMGMRVTCMLTDCNHIAWPHIGRIEAVLSMSDVLSDPERYMKHEHIKQCIRVAACACHVAAPLKRFGEWEKEVEMQLVSGRAEEVFGKFLRSQGCEDGAVADLRGQAKRRLTIGTPIGDSTVSPMVVKNIIRSARELAEKHGANPNSVGIKINGSSLFLLVPHELKPYRNTLQENCHKLHEKTASSPQAILKRIPDRVLFYNGLLDQP